MNSKSITVLLAIAAATTLMSGTAQAAKLRINLDDVQLQQIRHPRSQMRPNTSTRNANNQDSFTQVTDELYTYKLNSRVTSVTEISDGCHECMNRSAGGAAQYFSYKPSSKFSFTLSGEVSSNVNGGPFLVSYPGHLDFGYVENGGTSQRDPISGKIPRLPSYGSMTAGFLYTPPRLPRVIKGLSIGPEVRYIGAVSGNRVVNGMRTAEHDQFVVGFTLRIPIGR